MSQILVVDDDADILRILAATLECAGHSVHATLDPDEVQPLLASQRFDLLILDVMMPRRSGWEILEALRRDPCTQRLPVVMLSAIGDPANRVRGLRLGADDFLGKPFVPEELIARIEGLLERRMMTTVGILQGDFATLPVGEVLQTVQSNASTGILEVSTPEGDGWLRLDEGRCTAASFGGLTGAEAVLALLAEHAGHFLLYNPERERRKKEKDQAIPPISRLLLEAAWIEDELRARRELLPPPDRGLETTGKETSPFLGTGIPELPVEAVLAILEERPGTSLSELLPEVSAAPDRVRLAAAWLIEAGQIREKAAPVPGADDELDLLLEELMQESALRGLPGHPVEVSVFVESPARKAADRLVAALPARMAGSPGRRLLPGEISVSRPQGELCLHVRPFTDVAVDALSVRRSSALVLWLGEHPEKETAAFAAAFEQQADPRAYRLAIAPGGQSPLPDRRLRILRHEPHDLAALLGAILSPLLEMG